MKETLLWGDDFETDAGKYFYCYVVFFQKIMCVRRKTVMLTHLKYLETVSMGFESFLIFDTF